MSKKGMMTMGGGAGAGAGAGAVAGGIPERRVRPIWDAIDSGQLKNALKLSSSLLSKYPNSAYALALQALILERMGKYDDALSTSLSSKHLLFQQQQNHLDDLTLSTLQLVFQRLNQLDLATTCYEYACANFPTNLDFFIGLFNAYVRQSSFLKQQQTAIKMYKFTSEERFLLWAVCSIQLQVLNTTTNNKLLLLAEALLKKHIASHGLHDPEALFLYISILDQQSKFGDALDILSGHLGQLFFIQLDKLRLQGKLLARKGDFADAANIFRKVLESCPDDWECFLHYLGCLLEDDTTIQTTHPLHPPKYLHCKVSHLSDQVFDSRMADASAFLLKLHKEATKDFVRAPYLANIEIQRRKHLFRNGNEDMLLEALVHYFTRFGHLACFTSDVEVFLEALGTDKRTEFWEMLAKTSHSSTVPTTLLGQSISLFKLRELIGDTFSLPSTELECSAVQMVDMYCKNLPLSKNLDPQESMHGEELLSMACNVLVQLFWRTKNIGYLMEAVMTLELGLTIRRYVWQYKVLLVHLYSHLNVLPLAYEWYRSLDVKNILLESLSHHILPQMLTSPLWADLDNLLKEYLKFMDDHFKESADHTFVAYSHRNYSKVIEFVQFKERLQHSDQYLLARLEASVLQLKRNADKIEEEECILESLQRGTRLIELTSETECKALTFNEDLQSRPWWTPTSGNNYLLGPFKPVSYLPRENLAKEWEANMGRVVVKRSLLPRMVYLSIQSASVSCKEIVEANGSIANSTVSSELKFLLERYAKILGYTFTDAIEVVVRASGAETDSEAFSADIVDWVTFAVFLNAWNMSSHERTVLGRDECTPGTLQIVQSLFQKYIRVKVSSIGSLTCSLGCEFPSLVQLITESLAWHCLVVQSFVRSSLPSGKKKKKSGHVADQLTTPLSHAIRDSIVSVRCTLEEAMKWIREQMNRPEEENLNFVYSSVENREQIEGPGKVFQALQDFISNKNDMELGDRISRALESWRPVDVVKKIVAGHDTLLTEFLGICESKLKLLQALNQQMSQS